MKSTLTVAESAGFCFGVKRAVGLINKALDEGSTGVFMLGELIHNKDISGRLSARGVRIIGREDIDSLDPATSLVFIRAHGETKETIDRLKQRAIGFTDATCPYVEKIHDIVSSMTSDDSLCVIIGSEHHPEVIATASYCNGKTLVFPDCESLRKYFDTHASPTGKLVAVCQTTHSTEDWNECTAYLNEPGRFADVEVHSTVCGVTEQRQKEVCKLAGNSDLVIVIGGSNSANTGELYATACRYCEAIRIENANDLKKYDREYFKGKRISITAGASTPDDITQEVIFVMAEIIEEVSFANMLDDAFKTVHMGERVTGTVSMVCPAEIHVDLGTKHTGILPYDEAVTDSSIELVKEFHVGDKIDVVIVKFNDSEGTVLVSKKRFDADKNWNSVEAASEENSILNGKVTEIVKGGVIVNYSGIKVFVPASQTGIARDGDLKELLGQEVPFRIIETDPYKKRVVASIRNARRSLRKQQAAQFYDTAEIGQKIHGVVRSLTSFGAFVDLGGVDGMVHITELSWGRLRKPEDVLSVGDEIDVYIKAIDKEKKRISLGYKTEETNPWNIFSSKYKVGDVVNVRIASIMSYGAFATIIPGIDGLIHISQIDVSPVTNIKDHLAVDQQVDVEIIAINEETHKINLSRKSVLLREQEAAQSGEDEVVASSEAPAAE